MSYYEPPPSGEDPYIYVYKRDGEEPQINFSRRQAEVEVHDMRSEDFTLLDHGIELHKLRVPSDIDWDNQDEVAAKYYPEVEKLLKRATGASRVHIFDHTLRKGHIIEGDKELIKRGDGGRQQPVGMAHVDYTTNSGIDRLTELLPEEADKLRQTPFAVIQVWKPLAGPVRSSPLGVIDVSTVDKDDLVSYPLHFKERTGYNYGVKYNPKHRWYYAEGIQVDEAYVFVCYDSRKNRARFTPHTGLRDHSVGPDAPPRESVELRSYCFWENELAQEFDREL